MLQTLKHLYGTDPRWRLAAEVTVLGGLILLLIHGWPFSSSGGSAGGGQQLAQQPCVPAKAGQPATGNCTPVPQPLQPPGPGIVLSQPPGVTEAEQRLRAFAAEYNHAVQNETREGARCEMILRAARRLKPDDLNHASQQAAQAMATADSCKVKLDISDQRLQQLAQYGEAYAREKSGSNAALMAASFAGITVFDQSRDKTPVYQQALTLGQEAADRIQASDAKIQNLVDAARRFETSGEVADRQALVDATRRIDSLFERDRLTDTQKRAYELGQRETETLRLSDQRLDRLAAATTDVQALDTEANRQRLVEAAAAIQPIDEKRAGAEQQALIQQARQMGRQFGLELLVSQAARFPENADAKAHEGLVAIYRSLGGVDEAALSGEQNRALQVAKQAAQTLSESDRRLEALVQAADAWRGNPGPTFASQVRDACTRINDFDQSRFDGNQRKAYDLVSQACRIIDGAGGRVTRDTAIYVTAQSGASSSATYVDAFANQLRRHGFKVISDRQDAELIIELMGQVDSQGPSRFGNRTVEGAIISLAVNAYWAFDNAEYFRTSSRGNGANSSADLALRQAYEKAAQFAVERFREQVEL